MGRVEKRPYRSQWINSKGLVITWMVEGKESLFCFAKRQTSQQEALLETSIFTNDFNNWSLAKEGWPNLECHKSKEIWLTMVARATEFEGGTTAWNRYKPLLSLPKSIMLHWARSLMKLNRQEK